MNKSTIDKKHIYLLIYCILCTGYNVNIFRFFFFFGIKHVNFSMTQSEIYISGAHKTFDYNPWTISE